jgi:hypothetical protein
MIPIKTVKFATKEVKKEFSSKKHYKIVNLIIASRAKHYDIFTFCWLQYMNANPQVKSFFLYSDPTIEHDLIIDTNAITYKCEESLIPGILYKTLAAERFCQKYMSYDYILRTNLSSFIIFPRLLTYLDTYPKNDFMCTNLEYFPLALNENEIDKNDKCIAGVVEYNKENWKAHTQVLREFFGFKQFLQNNQNFYFLAGSFFVMSKDVIDKLLHEVFNNNVIERANLYTIPDDLVISAIVQLESIQPYNFITTTRYSKQCKNIEDPASYDNWIFHIRNRTDTLFGNREVDVMNMVEQVRFFYNMSSFLKEV